MVYFKVPEVGGGGVQYLWKPIELVKGDAALKAPPKAKIFVLN